MRLSARIGLAVGCTVPLLVLASGWLLLRLVTPDLHRAADQHLRQQAVALAPDARSLLRASANGRTEAADSRERKLLSAALDVGVRVVGPDTSFSAGPQPAASVRLPERSAVPVTVRDGARSWRVLARPVRGATATGTLWVFSSDSADRTRLGLVRRRVIFAALLAAPVSGLIAWGLASGVSVPLRRLTRRAAGLDPRTSSTRLGQERTGVTEVDELAATLRTVLARYDEQVARTTEALDTARSFSSAAAHELRTPLMSMGTNLDILADHPDLPGPERHEVLTDLQREHGRLLGLLVMLRELGRGDLVEAEAFRAVDVSDVADAAVAEARRRAPDADIVLDVAPGAVVHGWEPGLRLLLDNLLGNALIHGRDAQGRVRVRVGVRRAPDRVGITVDDCGTGVPPDARARIFERFERGPRSAGSGLGLTLVAQQAALHRGSVTVTDGPDGRGARFEVRLPSGGGRLPGRRDWLIGTAGADRSQSFPKDRP
ncbi:two-component sensor histidine kinase [Streptomyces pluripotens]|uniref:histidine kinase n=1 Tax=Streptomyces pluripotens TaxID=1355015 RepID=A0A221P348_9ACTN|nr:MULTISPECIES: HAMP domain-containing sensor histidine kinase [Streptomyces]ARP72381.1 two-component sensor histidine kinase [Streptomyces pluripotens]ASN26630.1 two-component sensor histidine kinase [Streptomyces pluripotens]KIE27241.1 transcriptional regulator [Streptomyces sp. MUSC 125]MCH0560046.1 HAMP domain-containing histidine kinase [Streptomyces sp. MUM 16J]